MTSSESNPADVRIKGVPIRGALKYVKLSGHRGGVAAVLADLSPEVRPVFDQQIASLGWYPYAAYAELLQVIDRRLGNNRRALMPELGRFGAQQDASTLLKMMAVLLSIERGLQQTSYFWRKHCDAGSMTARQLGPGEAELDLSGFPGVSPQHCRLLAGWIEGMGEVLGAEDGSVEKVGCVHDGGDVCRYHARWR